MPDGKIFHTSSSITYRIYSDHTFLGVTNVQTHADRVGVFSFEANKTGVVTNSAIVLTSTSANIVMEYKTITVGIGESVTINLSKGGDIDDLRWRHNYGEEIHNLRACPSAKWNPPDCEMDCPVCFNSGVCDDKAGICICPAGFQGNSCQNGCGNNNWGRECKVVCSSTGNCRGFLLCPPDPVGCACINGFGGSDCDTVCEDGYYGAGCREKCNCDIISCTQDTGCTSGSTCLFGYTGDRCLEPVSCQSGYFGVLCNFPCHCKDSEECNRDGSCTNGCHEAWAEPNCSIALPYHTESQRDINQTATTLTFDVTWIPGEDYGTGTITKRKLEYKSSQMDSFISMAKPDNDVLFVINNLIPNTQYQFYSQFSRMVGGIEVDGPRSALGTTNTICEEPLEEPEIELKSVEENQVKLCLEPVSSDYERIQCNYILRYQVKYSDIDGNILSVVNTTSSSQLEVQLSGLSSCTDYVVNARVVNNLEIAGNWGEDITVQTSPSEPSIQSNSFANGTHLLMKWNASTCDIPDYQVTYHYELSGGIFQQGTTTETEVVFDEGIDSCIEYTFTVLASYLNVRGTSDVMTIIFGTDCDQKKQG
ncbi:uncharacterized protein [Antedon mediterranea]|uniref:uncharacterized protein n=1 Tax=Antedon mediterranea TaxID=105859 RepID=UPI003AF5F0B0